MAIGLNSQSRASIERITGISYDDLLVMDIDSIDAVIEKKIGKKLKFKPITDHRLIGRGSIYLYLNRLFDFNIKKLNRYIDRIQ
jgi:F0F1-type ATP synthase delta subunit